MKQEKIILILSIVIALIGGFSFWQYQNNLKEESRLNDKISEIKTKLNAEELKNTKLENNIKEIDESDVIEEDVVEENLEVGLYKDLINKITKLDKFNPYDYRCIKNNKDWAKSVETLKTCSEEKVLETDIYQINYLKDKKIILILVRGKYGGDEFKLIKYNTENQELEIAKREDIYGGKESTWFKKKDESMNVVPDQKKDIYSWFGPPDTLIPNYGNIIKLTGITGDMGCGMKSYYDYDIEKNYITITKTCSACDAPIKNDETCTKYNKELFQ